MLLITFLLIHLIKEIKWLICNLPKLTPEIENLNSTKSRKYIKIFFKIHKRKSRSDVSVLKFVKNNTKITQTFSETEEKGILPYSIFFEIPLTLQ